jgi:hypothetical protein
LRDVGSSIFEAVIQERSWQKDFASVEVAVERVAADAVYGDCL